MIDIATGRQPRPSDLGKFPAAFSVAGEKLERRRMKKRQSYCNDSRANPAFKKRGRNLRGRKRSKSDSFMISMGSISPCDRNRAQGILPTLEPPPCRWHVKVGTGATIRLGQHGGSCDDRTAAWGGRRSAGSGLVAARNSGLSP
jgi:hypothetical protein